MLGGWSARRSDAELTADELTEAIVAATGPWAGQPVMPAFQGMWPRWRQLTSTAAHRGMLCFGPNRGRNVTYTNPRRWQTNFQPDAGSEALLALTARYLHAYGPAQPRHFAQWLNIPLRRATELFDATPSGLDRVSFGGEASSVVAGDIETPAGLHRGVRLLPYFDAFVVASQPRDWLYPGEAATRALSPSGQAGNYPVLPVDGVVGGVWHQRRLRRKVEITVEALRPLTPTQRRRLDEEVDLIGAVIEARPDLTMGPVTVGAHA